MSIIICPEPWTKTLIEEVAKKLSQTKDKKIILHMIDVNNKCSMYTVSLQKELLREEYLWQLVVNHCQRLNTKDKSLMIRQSTRLRNSYYETRIMLEHCLGEQTHFICWLKRHILYQRSHVRKIDLCCRMNIKNHTWRQMQNVSQD